MADRPFDPADALSPPLPEGGVDASHPNAADKPVEERVPAGIGTDQGNPPYSGEQVAVTDAATGETTFVDKAEVAPEDPTA